MKSYRQPFYYAKGLKTLPKLWLDLFCGHIVISSIQCKHFIWPSFCSSTWSSSRVDRSLQKPYIEIQIRRRSRDSRRRRAVSDLDCDDTTSEQRCCRYPLTVDFVEFGWDWVLAPTRFEAYYCSGLCPFVYYQVLSAGFCKLL